MMDALVSSFLFCSLLWRMLTPVLWNLFWTYWKLYIWKCSLKVSWYSWKFCLWITFYTYSLAKLKRYALCSCPCVCISVWCISVIIRHKLYRCTYIMITNGRIRNFLARCTMKICKHVLNTAPGFSFLSIYTVFLLLTLRALIFS